MEKTILEIKRDVEGLLVLNINDNVAWEVEQEFKDNMIHYLRNHIGNSDEFAGEFDPVILEAINKIESCVEHSDLEVD